MQFLHDDGDHAYYLGDPEPPRAGEVVSLGEILVSEDGAVGLRFDGGVIYEVSPAHAQVLAKSLALAAGAARRVTTKPPLTRSSNRSGKD